MRTTIPEKNIVTCDRCKEEIKGGVDLELRMNIADRDYQGAIVYGHVERSEFCWGCSSVIQKALDIAIKT
jgi:hypothetical protein